MHHGKDEAFSFLLNAYCIEARYSTSTTGARFIPIKCPSSHVYLSLSQKTPSFNVVFTPAKSCESVGKEAESTPNAIMPSRKWTCRSGSRRAKHMVWIRPYVPVISQKKKKKGKDDNKSFFLMNRGKLGILKSDKIKCDVGLEAVRWAVHIVLY